MKQDQSKTTLQRLVGLYLMIRKLKRVAAGINKTIHQEASQQRMSHQMAKR